MSKAFEDWYADYSKYWGQSVKDDVSQDIDVIEAAWDAAMLHAAEVVRESLVNSRYMVEVAALHECIGKLHKEVQGEETSV